MTVILPTVPKTVMEHPYVKTVHCTGTPFEIGLTHGSAVSTEIHTNVETYTFFFNETAKITWAEARSRAATQFLPVLSQKYPEILEEMRGIAKGAGGDLTLEDILALNVRSEIALTNYADGCTTVGQKTANGVFLAQNWDWLEELQKGMVILDISPAGSSIRMKFLSEAGIVGKIGLNSAGVGLCMNALRSGAFSKDNLPVHCMSRKILQTATSYDEAIALIEKYGLASTVNYAIADRSGKLGDIECSPYGNNITLPDNDAKYVVHTNHLCGIGKPAKLKDHPAANSFTRLERIKELTQADWKNKIVPSVESIRARLSDEQGTPFSICRNRPPGAVGMEKMTTLSTIIMDLEKSVAYLTIGRPCDELPVVKLSF